MKELLNLLKLEEMYTYMAYGKTLLFIFLGAILITYLVHKLCTVQKWAKYIPGLALLVYGLFKLSKINVLTNDFLDDYSLIGFIIGIAGGFSTLLFGLILGIYNKPKKIKKTKDKKNNTGN